MSHTSALYAGTVTHARLRPRAHKLSYSVFSALFDLDELPELDRTLRFFGHNRRALYSFHDRDHGDGTGPLRPWVEARLRSAGIEPDGGAIRLLCYPRILGFVFNPLTVFFCHDNGGQLVAILYEVANTHGERHTYVIPAALRSGATIEQECAKDFFVSPFVAMDCHYRFRIGPPGDKVLVSIAEDDAEGLLLTATFAGRRVPISDARLLRMLVSYPLMTLKVVGGIHWEALKLWWKGIPVFTHAKAAKPIGETVVAVVERR
jgi:hypothetical protein